MPERSRIVEPVPIGREQLELIRRLADRLEERLDAFQSMLLERHGDVSDEYDEVKRCYRLAAALSLEFDRRDA